MDKKPSRLALRLAKLLWDRHGLRVKPIIYRTYAGPNEKANGFWLWQMLLDGANGTVGSQWPASEIVRSEKTEVSKNPPHSDWDIDPV